MKEPSWCEEVRALYEDGQSTFKVASLVQRSANSCWKCLHPDMDHKWTPAELAERAILEPNRRFR